MNILVIFTGGTIGSSEAEDGYFSPDQTKPYTLLMRYRALAKTDAQIRFDTAEPYRTLSENLNGSHIQALIACVKDGLKKGYDGIIITHGTDTIQYTASALSYAFGTDCAPVVLVSSNYVLEDARANGVVNFYYAASFIRQQLGRGVFVSYQNEGQAPVIHRGSRLLPHQPYEDALFSMHRSCYGSFGTDGFEKNPAYREQKDETLCLSWKWQDDRSHVLYIVPSVGMTYPRILEDTQAVLLGSYHSGTMDAGFQWFQAFAKEAKEKQVPVFFTGAGSGTAYESVKPLEELGIHTLPEASPIAMYVKISMALSMKQDLHKVLYHSLGGDLVV